MDRKRSLSFLDSAATEEEEKKKEEEGKGTALSKLLHRE